MDNMNSNFETALQTFLTSAQALIDAYMSKNFPTLPREVLTTEPGRRYVRIVKSNGQTSRYVYCFVDKTNGDILKSETWKKPAKHARGNVYTTTDVSQAVNQHGANYL